MKKYRKWGFRTPERVGITFMLFPPCSSSIEGFSSGNGSKVITTTTPPQNKRELSSGNNLSSYSNWGVW